MTLLPAAWYYQQHGTTFCMAAASLASRNTKREKTSTCICSPYNTSSHVPYCPRSRPVASQVTSRSTLDHVP
eukprot:2682387-Rhodomonas_salina.2